MVEPEAHGATRVTEEHRRAKLYGATPSPHPVTPEIHCIRKRDEAPIVR